MPTSASLPVRTARKPIVYNDECTIRVRYAQVESYGSPALLACSPLIIRVLPFCSWNVLSGLNDNLSYNSCSTEQKTYGASSRTGYIVASRVVRSFSPIIRTLRVFSCFISYSSLFFLGWGIPRRSAAKVCDSRQLRVAQYTPSARGGEIYSVYLSELSNYARIKELQDKVLKWRLHSLYDCAVLRFLEGSRYTVVMS
jgi:hypothetical protein